MIDEKEFLEMTSEFIATHMNPLMTIKEKANSTGKLYDAINSAIEKAVVESLGRVRPIPKTLTSLAQETYLNFCKEQVKVIDSEIARVKK